MNIARPIGALFESVFTLHACPFSLIPCPVSQFKRFGLLLEPNQNLSLDAVQNPIGDPVQISHVPKFGHFATLALALAPVDSHDDLIGQYPLYQLNPIPTTCSPNPPNHGYLPLQQPKPTTYEWTHSCSEDCETECPFGIILRCCPWFRELDKVSQVVTSI